MLRLGPAPMELGPPPWSDELLECATLTNHQGMQKALHEHPGREIEGRLISLSSTLRLFNKTSEAILAQIEHYHNEVHFRNLYHRGRKLDQERLQEQLQESLYVYASCAMTLVDQACALSRTIEVPGYRERVAAGFAESPRHRFVQELRVDMTHVTLHRPRWEFRAGAPEERATRLLISPEQLERRGDYHTAARQFLAENEKGIDIGALVAAYSTEVNELHAWFTGEVKRIAAGQLNEYRRARCISNAVGTRAFWKLILSQMVIAQKRDPYAYLGQFLTAAEIEQISTLPHRSEQQVDAIIEIADEEGACNAELRSLLYQAFDTGRLWSFDEIAAAEPERAALLESAPSPEQIAALTVQRFEAALASGDLRIGWAESRERSPDSRVVMQFHVGATLFDQFFNARTGYRAQFRQGSEQGHTYNRGLIGAIRDLLAAQLPPKITARRVVGKFEDVGTIEMSRERVLQSLDGDLAKLWCCGRLLLGDGQVRDIIPSGSGPKLPIEEGTRWPAIVTSDADAWLDLNGAFLGLDGPYQIKPPTLRGKTLQAKGEA